MKRYVVTGYLTMSVVKVVEAASKKEAREKALLLNAPGLCHQCSGAGRSSSEAWTLNEFDDNAKVTSVEADE